MKIYRVGGAVRDGLLNHPVKDRDWVVVGSTPDEMIKLGFKAVGKSFPVFLHPKTHEEYALARTEKKVGSGHTGFECYAAPDVTLEEDLMRRDLTINAMALDEDDTLIDPYGGYNDLKAGILRHVSPAFRDDPLRVLRIARFSARFRFHVAKETELLLEHMVASGELDHLSPERIWSEWERGLCSPHPDAMLTVLRTCGALAKVWPLLDNSWEHSGELASKAIAEIGPWLLALLKQWGKTHLIENNADSNHTDDPLLSALGLCTLALYADASHSKPENLNKLCRVHADLARWPKHAIVFQQHLIQTLALLESPALTAEMCVHLFESLDGVRRPEQATLVFNTLRQFIERLPFLEAWSKKLQRLENIHNELKTITPHAWLDSTPPNAIRQRLFEARLKAAKIVLSEQ